MSQEPTISRFEHENVWLTQKLMAELYECSTDNISLHMKNIFTDKDMDEAAVTEDPSVTAADGKKYRSKLYSVKGIVIADRFVDANKTISMPTGAKKEVPDLVLINDQFSKFPGVMP